MGKFSGASVIPGAKTQLPVQQDQDFAEFFSGLQDEAQEQPAPAAAPTAKTAEQVAQDAEQEILQPTEDLTPEAVEQRERERVPALGEKLNVANLTSYETQKDTPLNAALARGVNTNNALNNTLVARIPTAKKEALAEGKAEEAFTFEGKEATTPALKGSQANIGASQVLFDPRVLGAAIIGPDGTPSVDPEFSSVLSLATENWFYQQSQQTGEVTTEPDDFLAEGAEAPAQGATITKATGNNQLGRDIYRAWKRQKNFREGKPTDAYIEEEKSINNDTFTFIGDMAKEVYAEANPEIILRIPPDKDGQVAFQLKNTGINKLNALNDFSKGFFSIPEVAPLNAISETSQPKYESQTRVKQVTTKVGKLGDTRQVDEAMQNYHTVKFVNDPAREKIALKFGLLALINHNQPGNVYSNMFKIGDQKARELQGAKEKLLDDATRLEGEARAAKEEEAAAYNPQEILRSERDKFLTTLNSISRYSDQINHVTFAMQGLTGRIHTQQNKYDPQQNKTIRFVAGGGGKYTWKPGSGNAIDQNFSEIMAGLFLKGGKDLTTSARLRLFNEALRNGDLNPYIQMGKSLQESLKGFDANAARTDLINALAVKNQQEANVAKQQLAAKYNLDDIPQDVKNFLATHKDEAPYYAEGLIELAKYADAKKNGTSMSSSITAEMDGKTHGPATNAALLGIRKMAERTGLLRTDATLLTDDIDSRKAMGEWMLDNVDGNENFNKNPIAFNEILKLAVDDRAIFLKKSPMTMGYGQELASLRMHVEQTVHSSKNSAEIKRIADEAGLEHTDVVDALHSTLVDSIFHIMDKKVVDVARLLRANNLLATMSNEVLYMDNAMGFRSYAGAKQTQQDPKSVTYKLEKDGQQETRKAYFYESKAEGSALRQYQKGEPPVPGGFGHGRVIPIAVQSYDGNMISKTGSGKSWKKIKDTSKARGNDPFVLPIFDAFKADLGSLDTVREEANRNWVDGLRNHSYVTSIMDTWFKETRAKLVSDYKKKDPTAIVKIDDDGPYRGINWLFNKETHNKPNIHNILKKVIDVPAKDPSQTIGEYQLMIGKYAGEHTKSIYKSMQKAGIPQVFDQLTNKQVFDLVTIVMNEIRLSSRNAKTVNTVAKDKAALFAEYDKKKEARQVDLA